MDFSIDIKLNLIMRGGDEDAAVCKAGNISVLSDGNVTI